jgi:hypothetical protein
VINIITTVPRGPPVSSIILSRKSKMSSKSYKVISVTVGLCYKPMSNSCSAVQHDKPRNTIAALNELIRISKENFDLNVYLLRCTSIADSLVKLHVLPPEFYCIFCESTEHRQSQCFDCGDAYHKGLINFHEESHIVNAGAGEEIPPMYGCGGMKKVLEPFQSFKGFPLSFNNITVIGHGRKG